MYTLFYSALHSLHHDKCNCNCTTPVTLHHKLYYTTIHPAVMGEVTGQVIIANIVTTTETTTPTTFQTSGFAPPSVLHNIQVPCAVLLVDLKSSYWAWPGGDIAIVIVCFIERRVMSIMKKCNYAVLHVSDVRC